MDSKESGNGARGTTPHIIPKKHVEQDPQSSEVDDEDAYMPALPPHLLKTTAATARHTPGNRDSGSKQNYRYKNSENSDNKSGQVSETDNHSSNSDSQATNDKRPLDSESEDEDDMYGPALPPHLLNKKLCNSSPSARKRIVGPSLPVGFVPPKIVPVVSEDKEEEEDDNDDDDDDDDDDDSGPIIGPAPPTQAFNEEEYRIRQLELRAKKMKDKLEGKDVSIDTGPVRESWMLELPEDKRKICGLGARQFLRKTPAEKGDRSGWTDTPADKARKAQRERESQSPEQEETIETIAMSRRDQELSEAVEKYNKSKRAKPLIDLHQKKLKKKEKESGPKERVPFSREEDMNVNKFDEAQKDKILKKARQLNDRFSAGNKQFL